ncbi:hypothetical protein LEP1GSC060_3328 [Leptospira weilii serovar Ranarum str. ICFT]|uniref:Uncharacterized protein n=1 Tax=Leptospira weilii serovar Ranarum str. ICFT TaxID=1218598 RepID=N1WHL3_9LEPT|nr:hypothetical protein LEP1GSC060_3328 [Leptospira weilii serovar Ranarum str. ICFT]
MKIETNLIYRFDLFLFGSASSDLLYYRFPDKKKEGTMVAVRIFAVGKTIKFLEAENEDFYHRSVGFCRRGGDSDSI